MYGKHLPESFKELNPARTKVRQIAEYLSDIDDARKRGWRWRDIVDGLQSVGIHTTEKTICNLVAHARDLVANGKVVALDQKLPAKAQPKPARPANVPAAKPLAGIGSMNQLMKSFDQQQ